MLQILLWTWFERAFDQLRVEKLFLYWKNDMTICTLVACSTSLQMGISDHFRSVKNKILENFKIKLLVTIRERQVIFTDYFWTRYTFNMCTNILQPNSLLSIIAF